MATLSAALRLGLFVAWTLVMLPPYLLALAVRLRYRQVAMAYWRVVGSLCLKARLEVRGALCRDRPLLLVSNHASYVDIVTLGAIIPGCFVSKAEVRSWPGIGFLAIIARTVFVDRKAASAARQRDQLTARLHEGEPLILFPEGTSSDGNRVLPFRTALFNVAERQVDGRYPLVQPMAVSYTLRGGLPMGYAGRPTYAWYGDMDLVTHLWELMKAGSFTVEIEFLEPVTIEAFANRKALSRHCETEIRAAVNRALTGRFDRPAPVSAGQAVQAGVAEAVA
ncbi:lysophospholipid acyltransferase family protein [Novispirillum sp. DQ9]|uniref:lysophospholipid acyltransferase family protein n=1 Tax=Novispirillum sp. DQ9 TaxID=3398612 RepID=UPI003C7BC1CB